MSEYETPESSVLLGRLDQLRLDYQGLSPFMPCRNKMLTESEMHASPSEPVFYKSPPSALEALRMTNRSRPAVIEGTS